MEGKNEKRKKKDSQERQGKTSEGISQKLSGQAKIDRHSTNGTLVIYKKGFHGEIA